MAEARSYWAAWLVPPPLVLVSWNAVLEYAYEEPYVYLYAEDFLACVVVPIVASVLWTQWLGWLGYAVLRRGASPRHLVMAVPLTAVALFFLTATWQGFLSDFETCNNPRNPAAGHIPMRPAGERPWWSL